MTALEYIAILFNDCGFDTATQRAAFMNREFPHYHGRPLKYADELEPQDRSRLIEILKDVKAGQGEKAPSNWSEDE